MVLGGEKPHDVKPIPRPHLPIGLGAESWQMCAVWIWRSLAVTDDIDHRLRQELDRHVQRCVQMTVERIERSWWREPLRAAMAEAELTGDRKPI